MEIVRANVEDAQEILSLQKIAYRGEAKLYDDFQIPPLIETLDEVKGKFQNYVFLKTLICGKIVGSVRFLHKDGTCYIGRLMVHPDFQNRGIATNLLKEIERVCSFGRFELFTGDKSIGNIHLYEKLGYKKIKVETPTNNVTLVFFEKVLAEGSGSSSGEKRK